MEEAKKSIILIVEDDEVLLRALYLTLHEGNFTIATAPDGDTGLKMAQRIKPDIILLDLLLPKMDGMTMLNELRKDAWGKKAEVIILTNLSDSKKIAEAVKRGTFEYLVKVDWNVNDVVNKVKSKLGL